MNYNRLRAMSNALYNGTLKQDNTRKRIFSFEDYPGQTKRSKNSSYGDMAEDEPIDAFSLICADLYKFKDNPELCDGVLRTADGGEFFVHRCVLFVASEYFRDMYSTALESDMGEDITLTDTTSEVLHLIIEYIYTKQASITQDNVEGLLEAAQTFKLGGIAEIACKFLENDLSVENCVKTLNIGRKNKCNILLNKVRTFILAHIYQVSKENSDYKTLSAADIELIFKDDKLNIIKEETAFECLMRWVETDPVTKSEHLPHLLSLIRFGACNQRYFTNTVLVHPLIQNNRNCQTMLVEAANILADIENNRSDFMDLSHHFLRPRIPHQIMFVIGGWSSGSATNLVETYDIRCDRWFIASVGDVMPRAYHGLATLESKIYMIGGFDGNQYFNSVRCFDPVTQLWREKGCMHEARCYVSIAVLNGKIYALGGYDGHRRTNTGETYNPKTNQWSMIATMNNRRSDASAAALIDKVYIAGGFDGQVVLDSSEVYDPEQDLWMEIHPMLSPRSGTKLCNYNNCIYVLGGWNGMIRLRSGEKYDAKHDRWRDIPDMLTPRSNFAIDVIQNLLFVIGGFNGSTTVPLVESFSDANNTWQTMASMNLNRSAVSAIVLHGLPNGDLYTYASNAP